MSARDFRRDLALVRRLMRQHRLADDVADGEDMRHVGAHLPVDRDVAALVDGDARRGGADARAIGASSDGDQDRVERLGLRAVGAFVTDLEPVWLRLDGGHLRLQQDLLVELADALRERRRRCRDRPPASIGPSFRSR